VFRLNAERGVGERDEGPEQADGETAIFEYLENVLQHRGLLSSFGDRNPTDFEGDRMNETSVA
jgi:hypothetical protein